MTWARGPLRALDFATTGPDPQTARIVQWTLVSRALGCVAPDLPAD